MVSCKLQQKLKLENHLLSAVNDYLFSIFEAILVGSLSSRPALGSTQPPGLLYLTGCSVTGLAYTTPITPAFLLTPLLMPSLPLLGLAAKRHRGWDEQV
jgi:hypothetical protein